MRTNLVFFYPRSVLALVTRQPPFPLPPLFLIGAIREYMGNMGNEENVDICSDWRQQPGRRLFGGGNLVHLQKWLYDGTISPTLRNKQSFYHCPLPPPLLHIKGVARGATPPYYRISYAMTYVWGKVSENDPFPVSGESSYDKGGADELKTQCTVP